MPRDLKPAQSEQNLICVPTDVRLFVYGSLLRGELHEDYLRDAIRLGPARTGPGYRLVELDQFPALIASGGHHVDGELYLLSLAQLRRTDELKENGRLFLRQEVRLDDGTTAQAYLMSEEKLRGRRRLRTSDWRKRFQPDPPARGPRRPFRGL